MSVVLKWLKVINNIFYNGKFWRSFAIDQTANIVKGKVFLEINFLYADSSRYCAYI